MITGRAPVKDRLGWVLFVHQGSQQENKAVKMRAPRVRGSAANANLAGWHSKEGGEGAHSHAS